MKRIRFGTPIIDIPLPDVVPMVSGSCRTCGCPPQQMPMINRGTGWCSENHRKQLEESRKE